MPDVITVGIYRKENTAEINSDDGGAKIKVGYSQAINDMLTIKQKMDIASSVEGKDFPIFNIFFLLVPDWSTNRINPGTEPFVHYDSESYNQHRNQYLELFRVTLNECVANNDDLLDGSIQVIDCLQCGELKLTEKMYMEGLTALGSNADIIKTRAIIVNRDNNHLQLDSNTKISNFHELYKQTFGAKVSVDAFHADVEASQDDDLVQSRQLLGAFNASCYDSSYVSVHNKIVYLVRGSPFIETLEAEYIKYCDMVNALDNEIDKIEAKKKNAIYSKVFAKAAMIVGIARSFAIEIGGDQPKQVYPAKLDYSNPAFRLTRYVVTAINQSWKPGQLRPEGYDLLKSLQGVPFGDACFDYACYEVVKKKLTGILKFQPINDNQDIDFLVARQQLHALSNIIGEYNSVKAFEANAILQINNNRRFSCEMRGALLNLIFSTWPDVEARAVTRILESELQPEQKANLMFQFYQKHRPEYSKLTEAIDVLVRHKPSSPACEQIFLKIIAGSRFSEEKKFSLLQIIFDSKNTNVSKNFVKVRYEAICKKQQPLRFSMYTQTAGRDAAQRRDMSEGSDDKKKSDGGPSNSG